MKSFKRVITEGEVVKMNPYSKAEPPVPEKPEGTWSNEADRAHWDAKKDALNHEKSRPEIDPLDRASTGWGHVSPGLKKNIEWATKTTHLISDREHNVVAAALRKHGFGSQGGQQSSTLEYRDPYMAMKHGSKTTKTYVSYDYHEGPNPFKPTARNEIKIERHEDGNFSWKHTRVGPRGDYYRPPVIGKGTDYQSLEKHLVSHFGEPQGDVEKKSPLGYWNYKSPPKPKFSRPKKVPKE